MAKPQQPGLVVRQKSPLNLEFPFASLSDWLVPSEQFYVRSHFPAPRLAADEWALVVDGMVDTPLRLTLDQVGDMPSVTVAAVMECAGNGRVFYEPAREGLQWQSGAVGNAQWTGVLLRDVLAKAGIQDSATEVVLVGADRGVVDGGKKTASPGSIAFARSLPRDKALSDSVLLAYEMNSERLSLDHGFPLRAVVAGWYGMAWIKWITEIRVVRRPFLGYWQARDYFRWDRSFGEPVLVPISEIEVKAQIARPVQGAKVPVGRPYRIFGAAWSGESGIREVLVDTTDGTNWRPATLLGPKTPYGWRLWEFEWTPRELGSHSLRCRAVDEAGRVQPETQQPDRESYLANWTVPVEVSVVSDRDDDEPDFVI
jgi:DMSO/TMAO reductase YedYZ molybdopterin-dependent catalytic subunit